MTNILQFPSQSREVLLESRFDEYEDDYYLAAYLGPDFIGRIMRDGNVWHSEPRGPYDNKACQTETTAKQYLVDCFRRLM